MFLSLSLSLSLQPFAGLLSSCALLYWKTNKHVWCFCAIMPCCMYGASVPSCLESLKVSLCSYGLLGSYTMIPTAWDTLR